MQQLQSGITLQGGKYRIEGLLGQGGFGNTYVGYNTYFDERIAIKEFFMQGLNDRDKESGVVSVSIETNVEQFQEQRDKFKKEALRIRKLNSPHIVRVHDLFEENGTTYYVMDFIDGESLSERLKRTGAPMSEQEVQKILPQMLDALKTVHDAGIWHLDLKPANIMMDKTGNVSLIDFGASKQLNAQKGGATTSTAISYTNGYAPREQMEQNYDKFGPWTDIYALGATLYTLLTNKRPPLPTDIDDDISEDKHVALPFPDNISEEMKQKVLWMLGTNRNQRPQNVDDIISKDKKNTPTAELLEEETIIAIPKEKGNTQISKTINSPTTKRWNKKILWIIAGCLILLLIVISGINFLSNNKSPVVIQDTDSVIEVVDSVIDLPYATKMQYITAIGECLYTGCLDDNNLPYDSQGEAFFNDGRYYKGGFEHGVLSGDDCYFKYAEGDEFTGKFRNNAFYYGKYTIAKDKSYYVGYYDKKGQPSDGKWYDKTGKIIQ